MGILIVQSLRPTDLAAKDRQRYSLILLNTIIKSIAGKFFETLVGVRPGPLSDLLWKLGLLYAVEVRMDRAFLLGDLLGF